MEAVRDQSTVRARLSTACRAAGSKQAVSAKTPCMEISSDHASPGRGRGQPATPRPSGRTDDEPYRGEVRLGKHRRISHGLAVVRREDLDPEAERLRELRAWLLVLPEDARYTHVTGAKLLGWDLPKLPEQVPVFAAVHGDPPRPRRAGLICSRLVRPTSSRMTVHDLPIDEPEEILLRAARDFGVLDLLILVCSARRLGHVDTSQMRDDPGLEATRRTRARRTPGSCRTRSPTRPVRPCSTSSTVRWGSPYSLRSACSMPAAASWEGPICSSPAPASSRSTTVQCIAPAISTARTSAESVVSSEPPTSGAASPSTTCSNHPTRPDARAGPDAGSATRWPAG